MSRWGPEKNIQFIGQYKQHQCLWDPKHALYKNQDVRKAAYMEIKETMNMESVKEVRSRIRMLRNTYNNELHKAKLQRRKSKIAWLPYMQFIKNVDRLELQDVAHIRPREVKPQIMLKSVNSIETQRHQYQPVNSVQSDSRAAENGLVRAIEALENVVSNQLKTDEFDVFGQNVAHQLRQMPLEFALEAEGMILALMRERRVKTKEQKQVDPITVDEEVRIMKEELCASDDHDEPNEENFNPLETY